eukprot:Colp12_sorted_trinity150504_noHs@1037
MADGQPSGERSPASTQAASPAPVPAAKQKAPPIYEKKNWLIHLRYVRNEIPACLELIEQQLKESHGYCEYPLFVKALLKRKEGNIQESLQLFQQARKISPKNVNILKQVARSLFLLGRHKAALEIYQDAATVRPDDWEILHNQGICYLHLKMYEEAKQMLTKANGVQRHDITYLQLGKVYLVQDDVESAIKIYKEALEFSPENVELSTTLGLLMLRVNDIQQAFKRFGTSLTFNPRHVKSILAAGSIVQKFGDFDVALNKYRIAAVLTPDSAHLWNNIAMCFLGKQKTIAAIACLKRAVYLAPFEWYICYNLGLCHLHSQQYASAFHFLSAAINLKPNYAMSYMLLGVTLVNLDDFENACAAYEKAIQVQSGEPEIHLNYAVMLYNHNQRGAAAQQHGLFERAVAEKGQSAPGSLDPELMELGKRLGAALVVGA